MIVEARYNLRSAIQIASAPISDGGTFLSDPKTAKFEIFIWGSSPAPFFKPITPQYVIEKKYPLGTGQFYIYIEVSELIRDFLEIQIENGYTSQAVFVSIEKTTSDNSNSITETQNFTAFDGYNYFEEEQLFRTETLLQSNKVVFVPQDTLVRLPIYTDYDPTISFLKDDELVNSFTYSSSTSIADKIKYLTLNGTSEYDNFEDRVLRDGGTLEESKCLIDFLDEFEIGEVDEVVISDEYNQGIERVKVKVLNECKYEPKKITFINKFGVFQDMYFFKKSVESMDVKKENYQSNILDSINGTYSRSSHYYRDFDINAREKTTLSSGFLSEEYNEVFKQLMLSEKVWITEVSDTDVQVLPINIKTSNITYKTSLNDKLVEYTIEFENSYNVFNDIR